MAAFTPAPVGGPPAQPATNIYPGVPSGPPSGPAGGVLGGNFPNPTLASGNTLVKSADIDPAAGILYSQLSLANSILASDIAAGAGIPYSKLDPTLARTLAENGLKMIRGRISTTTPTILQGSGFTVVRNSAGSVTITFTSAFSAIPAVVAVADPAGVCDQAAIPTVSTVGIIRFTTAGVATDGSFDFVAIGPA